MATTTASLIFYNSYRFHAMRARLDLAADTLIVGLSTSTYVPDVSNHEALADITNEVAGNGYARQTLTGVTLTPNAAPYTATITLDANDAVFTASGGSIVARYWWMFDDTTTTPVDALICYGELDTTPADVTATDGNTLTVRFNSAGVHTIT